MNINAAIRAVGSALLFLTACQGGRSTPGNSKAGTGDDFPDAVYAFLEHRVQVEKKDVGIVVGIVDERGSRIISCGTMDNGTSQEVNGDTLFEIGSITKTFTGVLLQSMVQRGEMSLDDPVANYLPASVKVPGYRGKQITLRHLATHTSGLPDEAGNLDPRDAENSRADYSVEKLDAFVSSRTLTREPGTKYEYSTLGIALLAQAIECKAGRDYESLVLDRICRPLKMDSTRISLTSELQPRFARGHNFYGYSTAHTDWLALGAGAALRSTANDMLKYVSANLGLTSPVLTPVMEQTHAAQFQAHLDAGTDVDTDIGLTWMIMHDTPAVTLIGHGGLTRGFTTFIGFDATRKRGVVVLCNSLDLDASRIGRILLEREWQTDLTAAGMKVSREVEDSYVGQYRISPKLATAALTRHGVGIRREGSRLFLEITGPDTWPKHVLVPPVTDELSPRSKDVFIERFSGVAITFQRDTRGEISGFSGRYRDQSFCYDKISSQPPVIAERPEPSLAIALDNRYLDAVVGQYEFVADAAHPKGWRLRIWRDANRLVGQASGGNAPRGAFDVCPASETDFFIPFDGSRLTFAKDSKGAVTAVVCHVAGQKDAVGKKTSELVR